MTASKPDPHWVARINAVGRAQSRYLWLLLVVMLFFPAVRASLVRSGAGGTLRVPVVDLELDAAFVLAAGPIVISLVVLMVLGTIRALKVALTRIDPVLLASGEMERFDEHPTGLDLIIYTTDKSRSWVAGLLFLVFPLLMLSALAEAAWLWVSMPGDLAVRSAWTVLKWATLLGWLPAVWHTLVFLAERAMKWHRREHVKRPAQERSH